MSLIESTTANQRRGAWQVFVAAMLWGTTGTAQALAPEGASPISLGVIRITLGALALLAVALYQGSLRRNGRWRVGLTLVAATSIAAYQLFFFGGVARTGVAVGTIVGIGSSPILAGVIGLLALGERPGWRWVLATSLAIAGCALLITSGQNLQINGVGILMAVCAGASYAIFTVSSKGLLKEQPPQAVMAVTFSLGALMVLPLLGVSELSWIASPGGLMVVLHLGIITVAVAYSLFGHGLQRVPVATAATLTLAEPLTAGLLAVFVLGEALSLLASLGIALIFSGLVLLSVNKGERGSVVRE